jgi:very-short-patch-repair endonuclease
MVDFKICVNGKLIDLEIDGSQHKQPKYIKRDKAKTKFLQSNGWLVYRIPWFSLYTEYRKEKMQKQIDDFFEYYNSLK